MSNFFGRDLFRLGLIQLVQMWSHSLNQWLYALTQVPIGLYDLHVRRVLIACRMFLVILTFDLALMRRRWRLMPESPPCRDRPVGLGRSEPPRRGGTSHSSLAVLGLVSKALRSVTVAKCAYCGQSP